MSCIGMMSVASVVSCSFSVGEIIMRLLVVCWSMFILNIAF